jgi:hypothetical protein
MTEPVFSEERQRIVEAVREVCIRAAQQAYEEAAVSGVCAEGAFEAAVGAMRMVELRAVG